MVQKTNPWSWFNDKVLQPVYEPLAIGSIRAGFATYNAVNGLTNKIEQIDKRVALLEARMELAVMQPMFLETLKRVELQLELMMARANLQHQEKVSITP